MAQQSFSPTGRRGQRWPWDEMEMMLEHIFSPPKRLSQPALRPAVDVYETPREYIIVCDVPGMDPDLMSVTLHERTLTISGERMGMEEAGEWTCHVMERQRGVFERAVQLPTRADPAHIEAVCKNGVLRVRVPKPASDTA